MFYDKGYPVKSIGDVVDRKIARVAKVFSKTDEIQYLDISSIDNASKTVTGLTPYTLMDAPSRAQYVLAKDDIVYSTVRPNLQNIAINPYEEEHVVGSTGFCVLRCTGVSTGYMWGVVNSTLFTDTMINKASGANYPAVTDKVVLAYEIPIPPEDQQLAYEHLVRQSDKSKFVRFKSQFIEMFGDPFENPKGYEKKTIGDVCDFQGGSQPPRKEFIFKPQEGYVRLIQIRDYKTDDYITYAPEKMCRRFCDADDIMIGRYGPPIFQILQGIEGAYNVALMKAIPHGINKEFMRAYLKRDELLHHLELFSTRTAGQSGIEMSELRGYPCLVPPEEEQLQYVEFVHQSDKSK